MPEADEALRAATAEAVRAVDRMRALTPGAGGVLGILGERIAALLGEFGWEAGSAGPVDAGARLDHVGIVVRDLRAAGVLWGDLLGGTLLAGGVHAGLGVRSVHYGYAGGGKVELLQPVEPGSDIAGFLAGRGEGMHHLTFFVPDLDGAVGGLTRHGLRVVDAASTSDGWREAYVSPRSAQGCVVQLVADGTSLEPVAGVRLDDVLADRWEWVDHRPRRVGG